MIWEERILETDRTRILKAVAVGRTPRTPNPGHIISRRWKRVDSLRRPEAPSRYTMRVGDETRARCGRRAGGTQPRRTGDANETHRRPEPLENGYYNRLTAQK